MTVEEITYFDEPGEEHTEEALRLAKEFAEKHGIRDVLVASTRGTTGARASEIFKGYNLVVVTHHVGFREPGQSQLLDEHKKEIERNGGKVLTTMHALSGVIRGIRKKFGATQPFELIANTLRLFGEGAKVCVEIVIMAADSGLIPMDKDVLSISGTGKGADSVMLIKPAHSNNFFEMRVRKVICRPILAKGESLATK